MAKGKTVAGKKAQPKASEPTGNNQMRRLVPPKGQQRYPLASGLRGEVEWQVGLRRLCGLCPPVGVILQSQTFNLCPQCCNDLLHPSRQWPLREMYQPQSVLD